MQINLIAVGKRMPEWVNSGFNEYTKRFPSDFRLHLFEVAMKKRGSGDSEICRTLRQEGEQMLAAIPKNNYVIALDVKGKLWDTHELAQHFETWREQSQDISLLIGGPEGLAPECLQRADSKWSLSKLTFPHPLVRIIVAEQLYRVWSILIRHPYHRS